MRGDEIMEGSVRRAYEKGYRDALEAAARVCEEDAAKFDAINETGHFLAGCFKAMADRIRYVGKDLPTADDVRGALAPGAE